MHCHSGRLEVICGPMFSGKTEELIRRLRRAQIGKQKVQVFKPIIDDRYSADKVASHAQTTIEAKPVRTVAEIIIDEDTEVVGIDEAQFLGDGVVKFCESLADQDVRVIVAGLDQTFEAKPFAPMHVLMAMAEQVTKLSAVCVVCGEEASRTFRKGQSKDLIVVGATESYEARCRRCYHEGMGL